MAQDQRPHFIIAATLTIIVLLLTLGFGVWILLKGNPLGEEPISIEQVSPTPTAT